MRQRGDSQVIDLLNNVRAGGVQPPNIIILKSRVIHPGTEDYPHNALHIFAKNANANRHHDNLPQHVAQDKIDKLFKKNQSQTGGLAGNLHIKLNARVILTVNIDLQDRLVNGQLGTVKYIVLSSQNNVSKIYIKLDDCKAGLKKMNNDNFARQHLWVPVEKAIVDIMMKSNKNSSPVSKRTQFPLMLAWACTVHKVQGLSLSKVVVSFQLLKQRNFHYGQIYVALSRVTLLKGLYILGSFNLKSIRASPQDFEDYNRLRLECLLLPPNIEGVDSNSLVIKLLIVRSFNKHAIDLESDRRLLNSDIIYLTDTQLQQSLDSRRIPTSADFDIIFNNNEDWFQSLATCPRPETFISSHTEVNGASLVTFVKSSFTSQTIKLLLLYKKHTTPLTNFSNWLQGFIASNTVDIISGDFNINVFQEHGRLGNVLSSCNQIVAASIHISGSLLDHVYIHKEISKRLNMQSVIDIYFSDPDAVKFRFVQYV